MALLSNLSPVPYSTVAVAGADVIHITVMEVSVGVCRYGPAVMVMLAATTEDSKMTMVDSMVSLSFIFSFLYVLYGYSMSKKSIARPTGSEVLCSKSLNEFKGRFV